MGYHGAGVPNGGDGAFPVSGSAAEATFERRALAPLLTSAAGTYSFGTAEGYEGTASLQGGDEKVLDSVWVHESKIGEVCWLQVRAVAAWTIL